MDATLTLNEIETRFDGEWVLVGDPEFDANSQLVPGTVLFHSRSREDVDRKDMQLRPASAAILHAGRIPDNAAVVL